jgi:hypothetical protein
MYDIRMQFMFIQLILNTKRMHWKANQIQL